MKYQKDYRDLKTDFNYKKLKSLRNPSSQYEYLTGEPKFKKKTKKADKNC